jgi:hypothetical protein
MDSTQLRDIILRIQADSASALALLSAPATTILVRAGEALQPYLDKGGVIQLEDDATFVGAFSLSVPGTRLLGAKASLQGINGAPALKVPAGARDVQAVLLNATTTWDQAAVQVGDNTIGRLEDLPRDVVLTVTVPKHRGKRAFDINGANVALINCNCRDVFDPAGRDSQGVLILNSAGDIVVRGGSFEAGSENLLVGGDVTGVPSIVPTNILVEDATFSRPLSWKTDGVKRIVKNLFELKSGINVTARRLTLDGCWVDGQTGWALMVTPRNGKKVANVLFEDITIRNAGGALNILGYDSESVGPQAENIVVRRVNATVSKLYGLGRFAQWEGSPNGVVLDGNTFDGPEQCIYVNPGKVWDVNGVASMSPTTMGVRVVNNKFASRSYGIMVDGYAYALNWKQGFPDGVIENNTFTGPTALNQKNNLPPSNIFVTATA